MIMRTMLTNLQVKTLQQRNHVCGIKCDETPGSYNTTIPSLNPNQ
jgi:hypothetical protein